MCRSEKIGHDPVREEPLVNGRMLSEQHVWIRIILVLPTANASLYCATDTLTDFRMMVVKLS
jgi:hypothetical protein